MFGDLRHGRDQHRRVVDGNLHGLDDRCIRTVAKHIMGANDVRQKYRVETASLQQLRKLRPRRKASVIQLPRVGPGPQPMMDVRNTAHAERVQQHAARKSHSQFLGRGGANERRQIFGHELDIVIPRFDPRSL